jgi:hypothetical protein
VDGVMVRCVINIRHPELVSGSMPRCGRGTGCIVSVTAIEAWMLKQVQHDEVAT